jgi:hypothetical protein
MNAPQRRRAQAPEAEGNRIRKLLVDVEWADIAEVARGEGTGRGDGQGGSRSVLVAGQYMGTVPRAAIGALDARISRRATGGLLAELTRRGALRCAVGDVHFFPSWDGPDVLVLGMGRQGLFTATQLEKVARCGAEAIGRLMANATVSSVLIGTGAGNLQVREAVVGLLSGYIDALEADPTLGFERLRIVERSLERALEILEVLEALEQRMFKGRIKVEPKLVDGCGGRISLRFGYSLVLASLARAWVEGADASLRDATLPLFEGLPDQALAGQVKEAFAACEPPADPRRAGLRYRIRDGESSSEEKNPDRVTFSQDGREVRSAAMTNMATVTERVLSMKCSWIDRIVDDLHAAVSLVDGAAEEEDEERAIEARARSAYTYLIHPDIRDKVAADGPLVLEIDRRLARIPWEMLQGSGADRRPLAIERPVARQLRTIYSPRVGQPRHSGRLRALVIGDPDPDHPLAGARDEAVAVAQALRSRMSVDLCIGAPDANGFGTHDLDPPNAKFAKPADLFRIIDRLQSGRYDLVHFAGHARFSPEAPELSGWLFGDGEVLTPAMLENTENAPALIFANACLSGSLSPGAARPAEGRHSPRDDALLVASLADEFLRRGVADYIGTAWPVPDGPARTFAATFYKTLLEEPSKHLGGALQEARMHLYDARSKNSDRESAWAAYQHYGDPTRDFPPPCPSAG